MSSANYQARLRVPISREDHSLGPENASITLIEYGDFECPHCARAFAAVHRLLDALEGDLRFIYRHFPVTQIHPHALERARAAEAAGLQGRFWEMHALLYENQEEVGEDSLLSFARTLGLDLSRFEADQGSPQVQEKIERDIEGGVRGGVNGTPTFFVNGVRYDGDWSRPGFLEELMQAAGAAR
jgi:protein-disulfide isomerase